MEALIEGLIQAGIPGLAFAVLYYTTRNERDIKNETISQLREDRDYWRKRALELESE